jgi:hypothetical protein
LIKAGQLAMPEMVVDASKLPYNEHGLASDLASALAQAAPRQFTVHQTLPYQILSPISLDASNYPLVRFSAACYIRILHCPHTANCKLLALPSLHCSQPQPYAFNTESGRPHALSQNTNYSIMTDQRPDLASNRHQLADWLSVSSDRVVTVEHPSIVRDIDKGLLSLGGEHHIKHVGRMLSFNLSRHVI